MKLTKSQKYAVVAVVVILIVAIAAVSLYLTNGSEESKDKSAKNMANNLIEKYDGPFGSFTLESGATDDNAVAMKENDSNYLKYSQIHYTVSSSGKDQFDSIKTKIQTMEGIMGGTPTEITGITGFDNICAYKMDIKMGTMTSFTLVYFVAYSDGVLIDASENPMYNPGSLASESQISDFFKAVSNSLSA